MNQTQRLDGGVSDWDADDIPRIVDAQTTDCRFDHTNSRYRAFVSRT